MSAMTSNIVTMTVVIAPTIAIITPAMADMTALIPRPIAEKIEPMFVVKVKYASEMWECGNQRGFWEFECERRMVGGFLYCLVATMTPGREV
ncbi:hypothetical protein BDZ94DRAFT_1248486 [Collybia nuda]|uniref:Secreted protein n=1 Tax=Collybia nuda TaxID=64659 RepID=A0A9P6CMR9_9AGAR|nr:hypothetical protein BDZ94DRAFT_1248486 [Collybia nuda]